MTQKLAVARMAAASALPKGLFGGADFVSVTQTDEELSIVATREKLNGIDTVEDGWTVFKVLGPLDFSLVGILADLSDTLAKAEISLFALSTYDTDYILVKGEDADKAERAFLAKGHRLA
ncbi:MAG: ACT domain-containing protein [Pseudomonadota bacterium]